MNVHKRTLCFCLLLLRAIAFAQESDPRTILNKVIATYDALESYSATGTVQSNLESNGTVVNVVTSFSIKLKKPNLYQVTWEQKNIATAEVMQRGALWSDGTQPYLYFGAVNTYTKMQSDGLARGAAAGPSDGAAFTIPSLFFLRSRQVTDPFSSLTELQLVGTEQLEGEACYVIRGKLADAQQRTLWISQTTHLIRQSMRSIDQPAKNEKFKITEQELAATLKADGQKVTAANKTALRNALKQAHEIENSLSVKGTVTELHLNPAKATLAAADMVFNVPAGVVFKASLLEGLRQER